MLALLLLAAAAPRLPVESAAPAKAFVRIERTTAIARNESWEKAPPRNRREIVRKDADGRTVVIRIIEHE